MYMALMPAPTENISFTFQATEGLMLTVMQVGLDRVKAPDPAGVPLGGEAERRARAPRPAQSCGVSCHER